MSQKTKHLATENIGKLIWRQSLPSIIGLLVISLYNVVDTIFIGQSVGSLGIAGLMIVMPIQALFMGFTQMIGMGSASIISRALGAKNKSKAQLALGNFFFLDTVVAILMTILGLLFLPQLLYLFGATDEIFPFAYDYGQIILSGSIFLVILGSSGAVIRAEGNAKYSMFMMILAGVSNIILDPIFIFGLGWGVKGAALATIIGQFLGAVMSLRFFIRKKSEIEIIPHNLIPKIKTIKEIIFIGSSSLLRHSTMTITAIVMNNSLVFYGGEMANLAVASYGIWSKMIMVFVMPIFGFVQGVGPIFGYNYGAKHYHRAMDSITDSIRKVSIYSIIGFLIIFGFTEQIVGIFTDEIELANFTINAIHIAFLAFPLIGFQEITSGIYQSMGDARKALLTSSLRQFIILLPLLLILPRFWGITGILLAYPIADGMGTIINFFLLRYEYRLLKEHKIQVHAPEVLPD